MRVLGIDEAGRGCVLGDLVIAGFFVEDPDEPTLRAAGAGDSKAMSASRREAARSALARVGTPDVRCVSARAIDAGNLNALEEDAIVDLVRAHRPDRVILDALGHPSSLPALAGRLTDRLGPLAPTWTIEPKADVTYAVVGAASVFAKTTRDERLDETRRTFGDFGSGYPSDPKTRAWLVAWARTRAPWPEFVRTRWQTVSDLAQQALV